MPVKLVSAGGGGVILQPASSIGSDVVLETPVVAQRLIGDKTPATVLQVVQAINSTNYSGTSGSEVAVFDFSITPRYSSSKIYALVSVAYAVYGDKTNYATYVRLRRGTTTAGTEIAKVRCGQYQGGGTGTIREMFSTVVLVGLDSPGTTSSQSYCVTNQNVDGAPVYYINNSSTQTNIILMEIAA